MTVCESHISGDQLEFDCIELFESMGVGFEREPKIYTGQYTKKGNPKYFEPDLVTDTSIVELKNAVQVGVPEKLPQTVIKLNWLGKKLCKHPYLVYQGCVYEDYIKTDVIMQEVMEAYPHVTVISFEQFCTTYK